MARVCFEKMDDERVLEGVEAVVRRSNETTAELLAYLAEVEKRGLHLREACSSMFAFCVERLHLSEGAAGKRITAARTARRFPLVLEMVSRGEIHLTGVNLLGPHLTEENHVELLGRARHRSKREIEKQVAEIAPRPDVAPRVVALPGGEPALVAGAPTSEQHASEGVFASRPAVVAPLAPRRYEIRVTVNEETHAALRQLQDLLAHQVPDRDPAAIISRALDLLLERTLARRAAVTRRPRAARSTAKRTRHIPAAAKRTVWERDGGRCAFVDGKGRRCSATAFLEYHHVRNWARGAGHDPAEIELRCSQHNQTTRCSITAPSSSRLAGGVGRRGGRNHGAGGLRAKRPYSACAPGRFLAARTRAEATVLNGEPTEQRTKLECWRTRGGETRLRRCATSCW